MKNTISKYNNLVAAILLLAMISCSPKQKSGNEQIDLKGIKPPEVKEATVELKMPPAVPQEDTSKADFKQDTTRFNYQIMVDNKKATGKISINGIVQEMEKGKLVIKTEQGQSVQMLFFIPGNQQLSISKGSAVRIISNEELKGASMNRTLQLESNNWIIFSAGIITDNLPVRIVMNKNIILQQEMYNEKSIISDSKYDTHYNASLTIIINGEKRNVEQKKDFFFESNNQKYKLVVNLSSYSIPKKEYESVSEGQGYFLDYLLLQTK